MEGDKDLRMAGLAAAYELLHKNGINPSKVRNVTFGNERGVKVYRKAAKINTLDCPEDMVRAALLSICLFNVFGYQAEHIQFVRIADFQRNDWTLLEFYVANQRHSTRVDFGRDDIIFWMLHQWNRIARGYDLDAAQVVEVPGKPIDVWFATKKYDQVRAFLQTHGTSIPVSHIARICRVPNPEAKTGMIVVTKDESWMVVVPDLPIDLWFAEGNVSRAHDVLVAHGMKAEPSDLVDVQRMDDRGDAARFNIQTRASEVPFINAFYEDTNGEAWINPDIVTGIELSRGVLRIQTTIGDALDLTTSSQVQEAYNSWKRQMQT